MHINGTFACLFYIWIDVKNFIMITEYIYEVISIVVTMLLEIWTEKIILNCIYFCISLNTSYDLRNRYWVGLENEIES